METKPRFCYPLCFFILWMSIVPWNAVCFQFTSSPSRPVVVILGRNNTDVTLTWHMAFDKGDRFSSLYIHRLEKHSSDKSKITLFSRDTAGNIGSDNASLYSAGYSNITNGPSTGYVNVTIKDIMRQINNGDGSLYEPLSQVYVYELRVNTYLKGKSKEDTIETEVVIFVPPRILHSTQDQWIKQGTSLPLYCNATGKPTPALYWRKNMALLSKTTNRTSVMTLNITGKQSGGRYCCVAVNHYGNSMACTSINVTEYQPISTEMTSSKAYVTKNASFIVQCKSDASPAAFYTFYQIGREPVNSTDGQYSSTAISNTHYENITCIPTNQYGAGPPQTIHIPIYVPPMWDDTTTTYTMTNTSITITCRATGNPTPVITWTDGSFGIVRQSTDGNMNITYKPCVNETLEHYCMASNEMGNTTLRRITVRVNSLQDCPRPPTDEDDNKVVLIVIGVIVSVMLFGGIVVIAICLRRKPSKDDQDVAARTRMTASENEDKPDLNQQARAVMISEESPYGEPIDAIPVSSLPVLADYATVHDARRVTGPGDENRLYASVQNPQSTSKKPTNPLQVVYAKVNKSNVDKDRKNVPLIPLYEEIPGRQSSGAAAIT